MRFLDLGSLRIEVGEDVVGLGGRRPTAALSALLIHLNRRVSIDLLLDAVWGTQITPGSPGTLETHVWRLRRLLEPERGRGQRPSVLINDSGGYRLLATNDQVDSARFEKLCLLVVDLLSAAQPDRALRAADEALSLWHGDPYEEIAERDWASGPISRLREMQVQLLERRVDCLLETDQAPRAIAELESLLAQHPFRERLWWQSMLALYRTGRVEQALQTYRQARRVLLDEVGVEPGPALVDLHQRMLSHDSSLDLALLSRPAVTVARPVELRLPRGRQLIAREADHDDVAGALTRSRLVTVAGPAGCGKTRLAINVARASAGRHPDGVWFVDLSDAETFDEVVAAVTATLAVTVPAGATPEAALVAYGRDRQLLLVLDNCEGALDAVAALCDRLLEPGLQLTLLTTSREPIGIDDEVVHLIGPLPVAATASTRSPAAELFLERTGWAPAHLAADDLGTIEQICRSVDGVPLAIELAAALSPTYGLAEIAELVQRDPGRLVAIGRGQARHHQTLSSAVDRSYRLLTPAEQTLHRRLSVLPAGFSRELAQTVAEPDVDPDVVPGLLARLVHRSLLTPAPVAGASARFQQLAPIRAHAGQQLRRAGETELAEQLRDLWTCRLVSRRPRAGRPEERDWYQAVDDDLATVRATLQRRLVTEADELGAEIAPQLFGFWYYRELFDEGRRWAEAATSIDSPPAARVRNQCTLSAFLLLQGRSDLAREGFERALAIIPQLEPQPDLAELIMMLSAYFAPTGDADTAHRALDAAWPMIVASGDADLLVLHEVMTCTADSLTAPPEHTLQRGATNYEQARASGNLLAAWLSCSSVDTAALALRDPGLGLPWCRRLLLLQERLAGQAMPHQLETMADFLALNDQHEAAVMVFSASHHRSRRAGSTFPRNVISNELLARCREQLPVADFDAAWARGATRPWPELVGNLASTYDGPVAGQIGPGLQQDRGHQ